MRYCLMIVGAICAANLWANPLVVKVPDPIEMKELSVDAKVVDSLKELNAKARELDREILKQIGTDDKTIVLCIHYQNEVVLLKSNPRQIRLAKEAAGFKVGDWIYWVPWWHDLLNNKSYGMWDHIDFGEWNASIVLHGYPRRRTKASESRQPRRPPLRPRPDEIDNVDDDF